MNTIIKVTYSLSNGELAYSLYDGDAMTADEACTEVLELVPDAVIQGVRLLVQEPMDPMDYPQDPDFEEA